jgi:hypothetical protein
MTLLSLCPWQRDRELAEMVSSLHFSLQHNQLKVSPTSIQRPYDTLAPRPPRSLPRPLLGRMG